jgi:hypothetical protein
MKHYLLMEMGIFFKFVEFLAKFGPIMNEHLRRIKVKETYVHYFGKDVQNYNKDYF